MTSPDTGSELETSIDNCHVALAHTERLFKNFARDVALFKNHLHVLSIVLGKIYSEVGKPSQQPAQQTSSLQVPISQLIRILQEIKDGTLLCGTSTDGRDVKPRVVHGLAQLREAVDSLGIKVKMQYNSDHLSMTLYLRTQKFDTEAADFDFGAAAAGFWDSITHRLYETIVSIEKQLILVKKELHITMEILALLDVEVEAVRIWSSSGEMISWQRMC